MFGKLTDHFKGGDMECGPNMKVGNFKKNFKKETGLNVRVYMKGSNVPAKDDQTLGSTKSDDFKGKGEKVKFKLANKVGEVEKAFKAKMGVKIQIEDLSGKIAGIDNKTLGDVTRGK